MLLKVPLLKQGDYEMWKLRIEQYYQVQDYALWEVIEYRNSFKPVARTTTNTDGTSTSTIPGPVTTEEKAQKKNDVKARSMLLMALPNEHQLTFNQYKNAKTLFEAIQARFGGNEATKKTQKTLLKQMYENFSASSQESLDSITNKLQKIVSQLAILGGIKPDLVHNRFEKISITIFKIVLNKSQQMCTSSSNSSLQNVAFVSTLGSTNEDNTIDVQDSTASTHVITASTNNSTVNLSDATVYAFMANQPNGSQVVHEDLEQIHKDDLKKWILKRLYDKSKVNFNCHREGHFARECRGPRNQESRPRNQEISPPYIGNYMPPRPNLSFAGLDESVFMSAMRNTTTNVPKTKTSISKTSKDIVEKPKTVRLSAPIIEEWDTDNDSDSVFRPKSDQTKPKFTKINFVKSSENVNSINKENTHRQAEYPRKSQSPRSNRRNWNGIMTQKIGNGFEFIKKACFRVNHQNKLTHPHPKRNFVPTAVATKSGQVPVTAAKQSSPRAAASISTARPVNVAAPKLKVNNALPITYSYFKSHSPVRRPFNQKLAAKTNNFNEKVNTVRFNNVTTVGPKAVVSAAEGNRDNAVKSSTCWIWRPKGNLIDHISKDSGSYTPKIFDYGNPQYALQDQGIFDSGCSRHMTGNKSFLTDYQEIDGGFVAFGGSPK
ncbi:hypothetical protein Tco_0614755 [Tanacetum coccineum]